MKKKNLTINRLALGNLKARKKQYTIMIIGILLSMIFSSGVLFLLSCTVSSKEEMVRRSNGNAYAAFYDSEGIIDPEGDFEKEFISEYGYAHIVGYGYTDEAKKDKGTSIAYLDENAEDLYYVTVKKGREPENKDEIAVEADALTRLGIKADIGDKIKLSVLTPDGDDFLEGAEEKTYTLVGIYANKRNHLQNEYGLFEGSPASKLPAAFVYGGEKVNEGGREIKVIYYNVFEEKLKLTETVYYSDGYQEKDSPYNTKFVDKFNEKYYNRMVRVSRRVSAAPTDGETLIPVILSAALMLASCIGIVNSFSANLQERKKQIGMLRAVGATRRQIISIFGREAFIITLICAPVSVAVSYFGVKLFAYFMGESFIFIPNFLVLFGTAVVSVICVMLAALIPLFVSSRISPMQAIRNMELSRKMKRKNIKSQSSFNPSALLAKRTLTLHRVRQISVSIILMATILLSCFGFSFMEIEMQQAESDAGFDYKLRRFAVHGTSEFVNCLSFADGYTENDISDLKSFYLTDEVYSYKQYKAFLNVEEYTPYLNVMTANYDHNCRYVFGNIWLANCAEITDENFVKEFYPEGEFDFYKELKRTVGFENEVFKTPLTFYSAELIEKYKNDFEIIDGRIDIDKLNSGEEVILVAVEEAGLYVSFDNDGRLDSLGVNDMSEPFPYYEDEENIRYTASLGFKAGDTLKISTLYSDATEFPDDVTLPADTTKCDKEVKIGAIVRPFQFDGVFSEYNEFSIISTVNSQPLLTAGDTLYEDIVINIKGEIDDATDTTVTQFLNTYASGTSFQVYSSYATTKENVETTRTMFIAMISIIILFFSISAAIINNTLTAKIRESKREIGTLRAVGASARELTLSYVLQMISMFLWGSVAGFGIYGISHLVLKLVLKEGWAYPFTIWQGLAAIALLIVICSINLYSKVKKEMKNSIVENIREL